MYKSLFKIQGHTKMYRVHPVQTNLAYKNLNSNIQLVGLSRVFTAAAAAKSLQSCPTLCIPIDGSPPGSSIPGILQTRILE